MVKWGVPLVWHWPAAKRMGGIDTDKVGLPPRAHVSLEKAEAKSEISYYLSVCVYLILNVSLYLSL